MSRVIVITSGKGGVGKSTVTANLGIALAKIGASVVMIDADVGLNNLDVVLGVENKVIYDLVDAINGKCRVVQALVECELDNLFLLPNSRTVDKRKIEVEVFQRVIDKLKANFDFVLIDSPAGIDSGFNFAVDCASEAIVVVTPHISAVRDADKVIGILKNKGIKDVTLVVNRIRGDLVARKQMLSAIEIENILQIKVVGIVPESDELGINSNILSIKKGEDFLVSKSVELLGRNVFNEKFDKFDYMARYRGLVGMIRRNMKRNA